MTFRVAYFTRSFGCVLQIPYRYNGSEIVYVYCIYLFIYGTIYSKYTHITIIIAGYMIILTSSVVLQIQNKNNPYM